VPATYRVFVTNEGSGDISVIDGAHHTVAATWPLGKRPRGIVATADGGYLFVALSGSPIGGPGVDETSLPPPDKAADGIGIVDARTGRVERVLRGVSDPEQLAIDGRGPRDFGAPKRSYRGHLFVASEDTGKAIVIDARTNAVLASVEVGGQPEGVAVSPSTGIACVTSESDNTVALIDTRRKRVLKRLAVGERPRDAAFSPDGKILYVSAEIGRTLSIIDVATRSVVRQIPVPGEGARPKGVVVARNGARIYVATGRGGHVVAFDASSLRVAGEVQVGARPWGIALSPDDRYLYTANGTSNDVSVVDTQGMKVIATIKVGNRPWGVAIGAATVSD
jgi:YVTN family beta-propeller protein